MGIQLITHRANHHGDESFSADEQGPSDECVISLGGALEMTSLMFGRRGNALVNVQSIERNRVEIYYEYHIIPQSASGPTALLGGYGFWYTFGHDPCIRTDYLEYLRASTSDTELLYELGLFGQFTDMVRAYVIAHPDLRSVELNERLERELVGHNG